MKIKNTDSHMQHIPKDAELRISEYEITDEALENPYIKKLPRSARKKAGLLSEKLYDMVFTQPERAVERLKEAIKEYPEIPQFSNYLMIAYLKTGQIRECDNITKKNYTKFPDYLFAKLNYAEYCLRKNEFNKIPAIFDHSFDLKELYPKRNTFHISETVGFYGTIGLYFCETGQKQEAELCYRFLRQLDPKHEKTRRMKKRLYPSVFSKLFRRFHKKKQTEDLRGSQNLGEL